MGLFQKAVETYDNMESIAGKEIAGKATLAPIGFISTKVQIEITLDENGNFIKAERIFDFITNNKGKVKKQEKTIIIPVTQKSSGRTSEGAKTSPHPLIDKWFFMCPDFSDSYNAYVDQLEKWCESEYSVPKIRAVLAYVKKGTIRENLSDLENIKDDEFVCWRIISSDTSISEHDEVWLSESVIHSYKNYCQLFLSKAENTGLCYISGKILPVSEKHLGGVVPYAGRAKLISANDEHYFTYRGRFENDKEALTISYINSQKAHNALKWIVANDGIRFSDRTLICWNTRGIEVHKPTNSLFPRLQRDKNKITLTNYKEALSKLIAGYKNNFKIDDKTVIAVFEAATTGRLSISYYSEIPTGDYFDKLKYWDETCCWLYNKSVVSSPALYEIIKAAYGTLRTNENMQTVEIDDRIEAEIMQRLLLCKLEKSLLPVDIMRSAVQKCSMLQLYEDEKQFNRQEQLFVTCALIKKYRYDHFKEEWTMALEPEKKNRSYQYGRLLAVLEKAEKDSYDQGEKRETNAIRMQSIFVKRPMHTTKIVIEQLKKAYYPRLPVGTRVYYEKLIGEIMDIISEFPDVEIDKPLSEEYLMGYYLQKNAFYAKKNNDEEKTEEN